MAAEAELIVTGSVIRTADRRKPVVEASAVCDGRILDLGTSAEMRAHRGPDTRMLDVGDAAVYPGFVDVPGSLPCAALACAALSHARLSRMRGSRMGGQNRTPQERFGCVFDHPRENQMRS